MMRLGPVVLVAVLQIPPAIIYDDDEAGAGGLGSSAPETASDDEALGPVVVEAVLPMPPVVVGAGFPGCFDPDTASRINVLRERYWGWCMWMLCS